MNSLMLSSISWLFASDIKISKPSIRSDGPLWLKWINFNPHMDYTVEVWEWVRNFTQHFNWCGISYPRYWEGPRHLDSQKYIDALIIPPFVVVICNASRFDPSNTLTVPFIWVTSYSRSFSRSLSLVLSRSLSLSPLSLFPSLSLSLYHYLSLSIYIYMKKLPNQFTWIWEHISDGTEVSLFATLAKFRKCSVLNIDKK